MNEPAISAHQIGKKYILSHQQNSSNSFRYAKFSDTIVDSVKNSLKHLVPSKNAKPTSKTSIEDFWALKNVSFTIEQGEAVGIIGRNGAGKSTLLKVLSRITEPTTGKLEIRGKISSLLEVGTGFHPELTGRENIFLNGAVLGMTRSEIRRKFDEIVSFAEVEKFLDTPVKRYSSGMYVRLAFSVAAHLEPDILIVDEVLAVGDSEFQKKCLGKMENISKTNGRTVLFVSHNSSAVSTLTTKAILLDRGQVTFAGPTEEALAKYFSNNKSTKAQYQLSTAATKSSPHIVSIAVNCSQASSVHSSGETLSVDIAIYHHKPMRNLCFSFQILNQAYQSVIHSWIYDSETPICRSGSISHLRCILPNLSLNVGQYHLRTYLSEPPGGKMFETLDHVCEFEVVILKEQTLFGWRPEACAYLAPFVWEEKH